jgi:hypothetical protein
MEGLAILLGIVVFSKLAGQLMRVYFSTKHPRIVSAWDEAEGRREEKRKKMSGGALNAGMGIAKFLMKK